MSVCPSMWTKPSEINKSLDLSFWACAWITPFPTILLGLSNEHTSVALTAFGFDRGYERNAPAVVTKVTRKMILLQDHHGSNFRVDCGNENLPTGTELRDLGEAICGLRCFADPRN